MIYLATSRVFDQEMQTKVDLHKDRRASDWRLIEEPLELGKVLASLPAGSVCLLDCLTMWLTNQMMAEHDLDTARDTLISSIGDCPASIVIVSNELGMGVVPDNAMARQFREAQGRLNIEIAKRSDLVVFVAAGLPLVMKGSLP